MDDLSQLVLSANAAMARTIEAELSRYDITYRQFLVIAWVVHEGLETTQAVLADRIGIKPSSMHGLVERMERRGWVTRAACPLDQRKKYIRLGAAAEPLWEDIVLALLRAREKATSRLTTDEVTSLMLMLRTVRDSLAG